jgi:DNA-binding MarR family transcriptional regulator
MQHVSDQSTSEVSAQADATFRALLRTFGMLKRVAEPHFAQFGISPSQWGVLRALSRAQGEGIRGLRLTDLGDRLLIRPPSVTGVVDRLERMGMLTREKVAGDQRAREVRLTSAGRRLVARVMRAGPTHIESVLDGLDPHEQEELQRLLDKLSSNLGAIIQSDTHERNGLAGHED